MPTLPPSDGGVSSFRVDPELGDRTDDLSESDALLPLEPGTLTAVTGPDTQSRPETADTRFDLGCDGRFRIESEIARGAMGVVCRGWDDSLDRPVAIKLLLEAHLAKPDLRRRFLDEARITARLQHPGIVPVHAIGEFPGPRPYYVMQLVEGRTLARLVKESGVADRPRLLRLFEKVCETIAYAHAMGVIHRDLKPANVMVGDFGDAMVMDWGVAKFVRNPERGTRSDGRDDAERNAPNGDGTRFGRVLGTPSYMSPEQARGQCDRLDARTDVFGLGSILAAILTGHPPYTGASVGEIQRMAAVADLGGAFERLNRCGAEPELIALARRCLAADPAERPADAGALTRELTDYIDAELRRAERDLVRFFELSPDLFCIAGLNGYFRRVNGNFSRVLGFTVAELLSRPFFDFVHPDDVSRTKAEMAKLSQGLSCVHCRNRYRNIRGEYRWFEWTAKSIPEEGIIFAVARDATDQIRMEEQLQSQNGD